MKIELTGKTALVTGSSAGIGRAIARGLAAAGARVFVNGRREATVQSAVQALRTELPGASIQGVAADVATATGCAALVRAMADVDILVNNAGIFEPKDVFQIEDSDWTRFFETNVMSGVRLSRAYLSGMLRRNWGRIVFISSESGLHIPKEMIHYGTTKTAQLAVSRGLAELTAGSGVTVNAILPGPTASEGVSEFVDRLSKQANQSAADFEKQFFEKMRPTSLLKRFASTEEVANLVVYVSSPLASATNGGALRVDGGVVRTII